jgi:predicted O-methyltransferase YrrM
MHFSEKLRGAFRLMTSKNSRTLGNDTVIPVVPLPALLTGAPDVTLRSVHFEYGNVSPFELFVLATLVADSAPKCLFEIGTFNGNITLQMAENSPHESTVLTLDLPVFNRSTGVPVDPEDIKYIQSQVRRNHRYAGRQVAPKVIEFFGDSANFDFGNTLVSRRIDFAFIDGSHSYKYVKMTRKGSSGI